MPATSAAADALAAWLGGQPHVAAAAKRGAGIRGELDHFGAMGFLQGLLAVLRDAGHPGLLLVLDEVETLQRVRGRRPGQGAERAAAADRRDRRRPVSRAVPGDHRDAGVLRRAQRRAAAAAAGRSGLPTDFSTDPRFDNPRAVQVRLPGFDRDALLRAGGPGARPVRGRGFASRTGS